MSIATPSHGLTKSIDDGVAPPAASSRSGLVKSIVVVSSMTLLSRVLGLARDIACAGVFGAGLEWDAFSFAFRLPNLARKLFADGALGASFIPVFSEYLELKDPEEAYRLAGRVASAMGVLLAGALLLGEAVVLALLGAVALSPSWHLALGLTAVMMPYMVLICWTSLAGGILNSLRHFATPAWAPGILNVCWIAAVLVVAPRITHQKAGMAFVLAGAVVVAGVLQLLVHLYALRRRGFRWRLGISFSDPGVRRIARGMGPVLLGLGVFQVNVLLDSVIALSLSAPEGRTAFHLFGLTIPFPMRVGANSVLYYANRVMQFPVGMFGIALGTAAFPALSAIAARKDWPAFNKTLIEGLSMGLFIGIPASIGLGLLGRPVIDMLFQRGKFTEEMAARTCWVLTAYSAALWACCIQQVLARAFYSLQDTRTPMLAGLVCVVVNAGLNLTLIWPMAESGLAAATAISAALQVVILYALLRRRGKLENQKRLVLSTTKFLLSAGFMGAAALGILALMPDDAGAGLLVKLLRAFVPIGAGACVYVIAATVLRADEMRVLLAALARKRQVQ